jgi:hypothetical protein
MTVQLATKTLYDADFNLWIKATVKHLKERDFDAVDLENLIEEIQSMGRSEKRELKSRAVVLLMHLLKWKYQTNKRTNSWLSTIGEQRRELGFLLEDSPSLKPLFKKKIDDYYRYARKEAARETNLPPNTFPNQCPFTLEEILDSEYFPG